MEWKRLGLVYARMPSKDDEWWHSHTMAPTALLLDEGTIRVYVGAWDRSGISRIGWIDLDSRRPANVLGISAEPVLDIGRPGTFDENGVFPGHVCQVDKQIRLYYTGFQLGYKVPHFNFGGLALSQDGEQFARYSEAPILDRADEGLCVRAGQSIIEDGDGFLMSYSAGSNWVTTGGKLRPSYDVYVQRSIDGISSQRSGKCIVRHDPLTEHGLGRPQLVRIHGELYVFYTRRILGMKYLFGCARHTASGWIRQDDRIMVGHSVDGFDSEMVYFPSVLHVPHTEKTYLFYSGNGFGKTGMGVCELVRP